MVGKCNGNSNNRSTNHNNDNRAPNYKKKKKKKRFERRSRREHWTVAPSESHKNYPKCRFKRANVSDCRESKYLSCVFCCFGFGFYFGLVHAFECVCARQWCCFFHSLCFLERLSVRVRASVWACFYFVLFVFCTIQLNCGTHFHSKQQQQKQHQQKISIAQRSVFVHKSLSFSNTWYAFYAFSFSFCSFYYAFISVCSFKPNEKKKRTTDEEHVNQWMKWFILINVMNERISYGALSLT